MQSQLRPGEDAGEVELVEVTADDLARVKGRRLRRFVGLGSLLVIVLLIVAGVPTVAGYLIIPAIVLTIAAPWFARRVL
jgi:hypothetical protein